MTSASSTKRHEPPAEDGGSTPAAKRVRTDDTDAADSSPAPGRDGDSPSNRGGRGVRGGGRGNRGGRGGGGRGGPRARGDYDRRGGLAGRGGGRSAENKSWGGGDRVGRMREWGAKPKEEGEAGAEGDEKKERFPKKKVAVLIGYNGFGYSGSQINPAVRTIEGDVFEAFVKAGCVGLSRAARTDAGVHAAVNVLTLKLIIAPPTLPEGTTIEAHINSFLPPTIRLWSILRVQGSFSPRSLCDQRCYQYTLPTHVFLGPKPGSPMALRLEKSREAVPPPEDDAAIAATAAFWAAAPEGLFADDLALKRKWRITPELLESARAFVKAYEGSHNYYNFTVGKDFRDRSCQRVMRSLTVSDPFIVNEVEYVSVVFLGQSFMLHQIRKMIALAILAIRTATPPSLVPETFGPSRIHIPKAPALGLILLEPQYEEYNKRVVESNKKVEESKEAGKMDDVEYHNTIRDAVNIGELQSTVDKFKQAEIYTKMWEIEEKEATFPKFVNYLDYYVGADLDFLNPKGVIPQTAMFKKGENPEKVRRQVDAPADEENAAPPSDDEDIGGEEEG